MKQYVIITACFDDFEPSWDCTTPLVNATIPTQYVVPEVSVEAVATVAAAGQSTKTASAAAIGTNVVMSGAMSQIYGMINGL